MNSHAAARRRSPVKVSEHIEGDGATNRAPRLRSLDRQQARRCAGEARGLAGARLAARGLESFMKRESSIAKTVWSHMYRQCQASVVAYVQTVPSKISHYRSRSTRPCSRRARWERASSSFAFHHSAEKRRSNGTGGTISQAPVAFWPYLLARQSAGRLSLTSTSAYSHLYAGAVSELRSKSGNTG
jgi:hypothetical protein